MKKFLLLLVGVLFALSASAYNWVLYVDIQNTNWVTAENPNPTVYFYCGEGTSSVAYWGKRTGSLVYGTIYKFSFDWNDNALTHGIFSTNGDYATNGVALNSYVNGTDTYGELDSNAGTEFERWKLTPNRLYVLAATGNNDIASYTNNFSPAASKDIYIAGSSPLTWGDSGPATTYKFTRTGEYTYECVFNSATFTTSSIFKIFEGTSWSDGHGTNDTNTKVAANTSYQLATEKNKGNDVPVGEEIVNPTVVVDAQNWTVTFKTATTPDPDPTPDYSGKTIALSGGFYNPAWPGPVTDKAKKFTFVSGSTYTLDLSGYTFDKNTEFKIYDVTGISDTGNWGQGYWNNNTAMQHGVTATLTGDNTSGNNIKVTETIVNPQFTLDVATWTLTISPKAVAPTTYSYRFHSNMVSGYWPADDNNDAAWAMTEQSDGTWMWQGSLTASGAFGFKRLADDEAPSKNNTWIYCSSNSESSYKITALDNWSDAKVKANASDESGHDWTFTPDGGTYQVIFNPTTMQTKIVKVGGIEYSGRKYVISGTFNGWIAPADNATACGFEYNESTGMYEWSYKGLMKNVEFKICDLTNLEEDSDKKWGKAYGTTYNGSNRDKLTAGTAYNMRRTNVPGEDVLIETAELYNPTFVLDPATMTVTVTNNPVASSYTYLFYSNFTNPSWSSETMTQHADGSWSYTCTIPSGKEFGIRQMNGEEQVHLITSNGTAAITVANPDPTKESGTYWSTSNSAFNGSTEYTIVFTPAKDAEGNFLTDGTGTLVIYNNTAVDATIQPAMAENGTDYLIVDGQKANEIVVKVPVVNYLGTTEGTFTLSMGGNAIASATADAEGNVTFEYLPYLSGTREFTLKGASKSVKLNVNSPALSDYFTLTKYDSYTLVDNGNGYADVAVVCKPTASLIYDIPVWYYSIGSETGNTYQAEEVYWSVDGFSFNLKSLVAFDTNSYKATESATAYCYGTPIFPFVVRKAASTLAEEESNLTIQQFGGNKVSFQVTVDADDTVSGVEGVVIEAEDAPVEYYNLQGQRVNGDLAPGIYIRRQGTTVTKVRI